MSHGPIMNHAPVVDCRLGDAIDADDVGCSCSSILSRTAPTHSQVKLAATGNSC